MTKIALGFSNFIDKKVLLHKGDLERFLNDKNLDNYSFENQSFKNIFISHFRGKEGREYCFPKEIYASIEKHFDCVSVIGGTSTRVAIYLNHHKIKSVLHINSVDKNLTNMQFPNITFIPTAHKQRSVHYIFEYQKGDVLKINDKTIVAAKTDRIIIVDEKENPLFPLNPSFFSQIDQCTKILFISSFNTAKTSADIVLIRNHYINPIKNLKRKNTKLRLIFEDCGHHDINFKEHLMASFSGLLDIYSCNEEELLDFNQIYNLSSDTTVDLIVEIMTKVQEEFLIPIFIVHTKNYVLVKGDIDKHISNGITKGILSATYWYIHGENPKKNDLLNIEQLANNEGYKAITAREGLHIFPTKKTSSSGCTLGLGDCFIGAFIAELARNSRKQ